MPLTDGQKNGLLIGGGVGALALLGVVLLGRRSADAPPRGPAGPRDPTPRDLSGPRDPVDPRSLQAPVHPAHFPVQARSEQHKRKRRRRDRDDDNERGERGERTRSRHDDDNARGKYGRRKKRKKHKRHHVGADVFIGQRPQHLIFPATHREEGPGAPIWRLNERVRSFVLELGNVMSKSEQLWSALRPVWEREVLPFLTEWEPFWRDSSRWSWSEFDRWATRWNVIVALATTTLQSKERERGQ